MKPMVKLLNPHVCIKCGGQLAYTAMYTNCTTGLIDPKTGYFIDDTSHSEEFDDVDEYLECTKCHTTYPAKYIIDGNYDISYTVDSIANTGVAQYPEGTIFRENVFYEF